MKELPFYFAIAVIFFVAGAGVSEYLLDGQGN